MEEGRPTAFQPVWYQDDDGPWTVHFAYCKGDRQWDDSGPWRIVGSADVNNDAIDDLILQSGQ